MTLCDSFETNFRWISARRVTLLKLWLQQYSALARSSWQLGYYVDLPFAVLSALLGGLKLSTPSIQLENPEDIERPLQDYPEIQSFDF